MINSDAQSSLLHFIPDLDFRKIRSLLKVEAPVRTIPAKWRARSISLILRGRNDREGVLGVVYSSQDGQRLICLCTESTTDVGEDNILYLAISPMEYVERATRISGSKRNGIGFSGLYSDIEGKEDETKTVSLKDRAWVKHCLAPNKLLPVLADQSTLG